MQRTQESALEIKIPGYTISNLKFVDDIDLIAKKWIKLQTRLAMLTKTAIEYGLEVNVGRSDRFWLEIAEKQHILN